MIVQELIDILSRCDPALPIAVHANNHTYKSGLDEHCLGACRVGLLYTYGGTHVVIGNVSKKNINGKNWSIEHMVDGQPEPPMEWRDYR